MQGEHKLCILDQNVQVSYLHTDAPVYSTLYRDARSCILGICTKVTPVNLKQV